MNSFRNFSTHLLSILAASLLLAGCATPSPREASIRAQAVQLFGTDANLKIHEVWYSGPVSGGLSSGMGNTSDEQALAVDLQAAKNRPVDLVVWSASSHTAASTLLSALRNPGLRTGLTQLRLLFVGTAQDAQSVGPAVEATGAKFYARQL